MGILSDPTTTILPPASVAASALVEELRTTWARMVGSFNAGAIFFWKNPDGLTPQQIADALGASGAEVFRLHGKLGELIAEIDPAIASETMQIVGEFQYEADGRVTILTAPEPAP